MSESPSIPEIDAHLRVCGAQLLKLALALDKPFRPKPEVNASVMFGHRSRDLFIGIDDCYRGAAPIVASTLLRSMVEVNICLRFILQRDSKLRLELWQAEDARIRLAMISEIPKLPQVMLPDELLEPEIAIELRKQVSDARAAAIKKGVPGVGEKGAVFPQTKAQVEALKDPAVDRAYTMAYRPLSGHVHVGAWAFNNALIAHHEGGLVSFKDRSGRDDDMMVGARALALTTFASTLVIASEAAGLGVEHEADAIKREWIPDEPPLSERQAASGEATT
jgi:hypothetical protein